MRTRWTRLAEQDLDHEADWIDDHSGLDAALKFYDDVLERVLLIGVAPKAHPEIRVRNGWWRKCPWRDFLIYYTIDDRGVRVERLLPGAMDQGRLLN